MKIRKSIDHFTGKEQNALLCIRKVITDTLNPELLFFLNSQAFTSLRRDYLIQDRRIENFHFSCCLLAILPEQQDEGLISELESSLLSFGKVNLIVFPMERFVLELQNKTFFLPTIYRHAILLFEQQKGCFRSVLDTVWQEAKPSTVSGKYLPDPETVNNGLNGRRHEASTLLTFYESLNKLIHAAFLIREMDHSNRPANLTGVLEPDKDHLPETKHYAQEGAKDTWELFPRSLSREQFINPYLVFKDFFVFRSLQEWKEELHNMLHLSFSDSTLEDTGEVVDLLNIKAHLDKLVEACHLILVREPEITERCRAKQTGA